jgi:hypothetical protein
MYDKALLMGQCIDKAVTIKKTTSGKLLLDKILLDKNVKGCIDVHLTFIGWLKTAKGLKWKQSASYLGCLGYEAPYRFRDLLNVPYDFLGLKDVSYGSTDYIAMRECYENSTERQLEKLLKQ